MVHAVYSPSPWKEISLSLVIVYIQIFLQKIAFPLGDTMKQNDVEHFKTILNFNGSFQKSMSF